MKTRTDLLNHLAGKYNLQRYLEIGVQVPELNFDKINCTYKVGVDPDPRLKGLLFNITSDTFFKLGLTEEDGVTPFKWDLIFIDGLHTAEQVKKDFENSLRHLSPNGIICLHDCNPEKEEHTIVPRPTERGHWNGDVYKFAASMLTNSNSCTVDIDNGCLIWQNTTGGQYATLNRKIDWNFFDKNRKELLNLVTWDEFIAIDPHV